MNLHGHSHDPNEAIGESWENELHKRAQSQPLVTCALSRTTHPNELTRTPSIDPPEWIYMGARMTKTK